MKAWKIRGIKKALLEGVMGDNTPTSMDIIADEFNVSMTEVSRIYRKLLKKDREIRIQRKRDTLEYHKESNAPQGS